MSDLGVAEKGVGLHGDGENKNGDEGVLHDGKSATGERGREIVKRKKKGNKVKEAGKETLVC